MPFVYLIIASLFEIGWALGMKLVTITPYKAFWTIFTIISMALSGIFLYIAQKNIPIGIAYAIWTSIGTIATFLIGIIFFHDSASFTRYLGIALIILGIILLKA